MDIKTLEQALKLQTDLTTRLSQSQTSQRSGKLPAIEVMLKDREQLLASAQAEVETALKERDAAVSRWDERVAQRKANVTKLQGEMKDLKAQLAKQGDIPKNSNTGNLKKVTPGKKPA